MKIVVQFNLELNNPIEKLVYDLLMTMPTEGAKKEYLLSSMLYYSRSPSYLAESRMAEYLKKLEELSFFFTDENYLNMVKKIEELAAMKSSLVGSVSESVASRIESVLENLDLSAARKSVKPKATEKLPEEVFSGMMDTFSV